MPRRAFYMGTWINHSGWYPDRKIRLYNRSRCHWEGTVHEGLQVDGQVETFQGDLLHFPFRSWHDQVDTLEKYVQLAVDAARSSASRGSFLKLIVGPPSAFIGGFFFHAGFLDGWRGFAIAYLAARYVFQREFRILRSWNWRWL